MANVSVKGNGRIRVAASWKIQPAETKGACPVSERKKTILERVNLFPKTDGFLIDQGRVSIIRGQEWDSETLRDYYLHFASPVQALILADEGLSKYQFGSDLFWDCISAFVLYDQIYVIEREKIGRFNFDPEMVIPLSLTTNAREYPVPGLRHCALMTKEEAKVRLQRVMAIY